MTEYHPLPLPFGRVTGPGDLAAALGAVVRAVSGSNLRALREAAGLTQAAVAQETGITQQHISQVERGQAKPGADIAVRLWEVLASRQRGEDVQLISA
jgi:DNA-binding XRE family transcriptional regulator